MTDPGARAGAKAGAGPRPGPEAVLRTGRLAVAAGGLVPRVGPKWVYRLGVVGLAGVLVGRGVLGPLTHGGATPEYIRQDWLVYSPLCLALGALALSLAAGMARPKPD